MPLSDIICGAFTAQYAPIPPSGSYSFVTLGTLTNDGIDEVEVMEGTELTTNLYGETIMDGITAGSKEMTLDFVLQSANLAGVKELLKPTYMDTDTGINRNTGGSAVLEGAVSPAGQLWSAVAGRLVLTPVAGTSADYGDGTSHMRYYKHVMIRNGSEIRKKFWYRERYVPISLRVLPYLDANNVFRFWEYVAALPTS